MSTILFGRGAGLASETAGTLPVTTPHSTASRSSVNSISGNAGFSGWSHARVLVLRSVLTVNSPSIMAKTTLPSCASRERSTMKQVAALDRRMDHALAFRAHHEGPRRVVDQQLVEVNRSLQIALGGRREAGLHARLVYRNGNAQTRKRRGGVNGWTDGWCAHSIAGMGTGLCSVPHRFSCGSARVRAVLRFSHEVRGGSGHAHPRYLRQVCYPRFSAHQITVRKSGWYRRNFYPAFYPAT